MIQTKLKIQGMALMLIGLAGITVINCVGPLEASDDEVREGELQLINSYQLPINDPSGLVIDMSGDFMWTVSDDPGEFIYKIRDHMQKLGSFKNRVKMHVWKNK